MEQKKSPSRVVIDRLSPEIDGGRFPARCFIDEGLQIKAILLIDGHDHVKGRLLFRHDSEEDFRATPLIAKGNDEWTADFKPEKLGRYFLCVEAAMDRFDTWKTDLCKRLGANQKINVDLLSGVILMKPWLESLSGAQKTLLQKTIEQIQKWADSSVNPTLAELTALLQAPAFDLITQSFYDEKSLVRYEREVPIQVEPVIARFSSWYEFFPRSTTEGPARHGTFKDAEKRLDYIRKLGFNVVYLPPIHPIGSAFRKGKNNSLEVVPGDVGSPWAIGAKTGGHKDILPELGTFKDFDSFLQKAQSLGLEVALDMAFQCSPDHPYVTEHPEWFKKRPDGTIQYAENPPKKYQDIYPFDFESTDWQGLWNELRDVIAFWVGKGVRVFRVDNPHTKPFHFWEWLIKSIRSENPEVIFLAEAFTRPHIMAYLAKAGFSQSYTYFTWRNVKWEITQYMTELTQTDLVNYFGPNFWPNTPDILPESLQKPQRPVYMERVILAATLSSNYGLYGPAYELMDYKPMREKSEEYLDSEKYQLRQWDLKKPESLAPLLQLLNEIRSSQKALQQNHTLRFHPVSNDNLIAYSKTWKDEKVLVVVNLDPQNVQSGLVELPLIDWKIDESENFEVHDLLSDARYFWHGWRNFIELGPQIPAHIFRVKPPAAEKTEMAKNDPGRRKS